MVNEGSRTYVAAVGDPEDPATLSGWPHYLLRAGVAAGTIHGGLPLRLTPWAMRLRRWRWNGIRVVTGGGIGGFQYSTEFLEEAWRGYQRSMYGCRIVNFFQLYAPSVNKCPHIERWFYVDMALRHLFEYYGVGASLGRRIRMESLRLEAEGYVRADGIVTATEFGARGLRELAGVPVEKLHVIAPGAGLDQGSYAEWEAAEERRRFETPADERPMRIVFVGREWQRHGVDRVLRAFEVLRREGSRAVLRLIGQSREKCPERYRDLDGVEWCGWIPKVPDARRYMQLVGECDVACHLTRENAGSLAVRDFQALGLPIVGIAEGGVGEYHFPETHVTICEPDRAESVASILARFEEDLEYRASMKRAAWLARSRASWSEPIRQFTALWGQ